MRSPERLSLIVESGLVPYPAFQCLQQRLLSARTGNQIGDTLLVLEHEPVYTFGSLTPPEDIQDVSFLQAPVCRSDRGGRLTFHGPGQIVFYPIIRLDVGLNPVSYLRELERVIVNALLRFRVDAHTVSGLSGVWCRRHKIASVAAGVSGGVTRHGFAVNIDVDPSYIRRVSLCGLAPGRVASLRDLGFDINKHDLQTELIHSFSVRFKRRVVVADQADWRTKAMSDRVR